MATTSQSSTTGGSSDLPTRLPPSPSSMYKPIMKKPSDSQSLSEQQSSSVSNGEEGSQVTATEATEEDMKKARKVRFNPYVQRARLPADEWEEAQAARRTKIKEAPFHDELWDGDACAFREKELTPDELWALRIRSKVSSLPRKLTKPLKRGVRAMQNAVPGSKPVDLVGAHARKLRTDETKPDEGDETFTKPPLLRRQSSLVRGHHFTLELEGLTPASFDRYDELVAIIQTFKGVPEELIEAERNLAQYRKQLQAAKDALRDLRFQLPEVERRLAKNANPRLLHYMQFSRDDKVRRLENEYEMLKKRKDEEQKKVETLAMAIHKENERVDKLGNNLATLRGAEAEKAALEMFVAQEFGEDDAALNKLVDTLEEYRVQLDKEASLEKKLRVTTDVFSNQVVGDYLQKALKALAEANSMIALAHPSAASASAASPEPSRAANSSSNRSYPSLVPSIIKAPLSLSQRSYASLNKSDASTSSSASTETTTALSNLDLSALAKRRRDLLATARENVFKAVDTLETSLDEIEEQCRDRWSKPVLDWRLDIHALDLEEVFGSTAALLRKRTTSDGFDALTASFKNKTGGRQQQPSPSAAAAAEAQMVQELKSRIERKQKAVRKLSEITMRYVEFFYREVSRVASRMVQLNDKKKELEKELAEQRKVVFAAVKQHVLRVHGRKEEAPPSTTMTSTTALPQTETVTSTATPGPGNMVMREPDIHEHKASFDVSGGGDDFFVKGEEEDGDTMSVRFPSPGSPRPSSPRDLEEGHTD